MGGAIFVSAGEALFANQLIDSLQKNVPDINPAEVSGVGATELRNHFAPGVLPGIIASYMEGLQVAFIMVTVLAGCSALLSPLLPWVNIKGKVSGGMA
jgi:hypothetical protein